MLERRMNPGDGGSAPSREASATPGGAPAASGPGRTGGLVLTRHLDQAVVIAGEIEIQVVGLKAQTARLKITAPRSIPVHRREVYEAIRAEPRPSPARPPASRRGQGGLVLARHIGEKVMIGDDVEVEVADVRAASVRLRITAPRDVTVHRREIHEAILRGEPARPGAGGVARA